MNDAAYRTLAASLPELTHTQLSDLLSRAKLLSSVAPTVVTGKQDFGVRVTDAICDVLRKQGVETVSSSTLRKSSAYASSREKMKDLNVFLEKASSQRIIQDAILREAVKLLYFDLLNWQGIAISSHTLLQQIHRIPATLQRHYPGYAASGLLIKILKVAA